jgi:hypothetical protein
MRKDEYISEVVSGVKSKSARQEIAAELSSHIDELADFYLDRGYNETEAEEKAVSEMGDGEKIGYDMSKLHKTGGIDSRLMSLLILLFNIHITIIVCWKSNNELCIINIIIEALVILAAYATVRSKAKQYSLGGILAVVGIYVLYFGIQNLYYPSAISTYLLYTFKGRIDAFAILPYISNINFSFTIFFASAVFYTIMLVPMIICAVRVGKTGKSFGAFNIRFIRKALKVIMSSFAGIILIILTMILVKTVTYNYPKHNLLLNSFAIAQSDNPCDVFALNKREEESEGFSRDLIQGYTVQRISSANTFTLEVENWSDGYGRYASTDVIPNFKFRQDIREKETEIDEDISYSTIIYEIEIIPTKRYMYLKPFDYTLPSGVETEYWLRTNEEYVVEYSLDNSRIPHSMLEVTIHNREINQSADLVKPTG